jgi:hypothetical protein
MLTVAAIVTVTVVLGVQLWRAQTLRVIRQQFESADTFLYDERYFNHTPSARQVEYRRGDPRFERVRDKLVDALSHQSWLATWGGEGAGLLHCSTGGKNTLDIEVWWYAIVVNGRGFEVPDDSVRKLLSEKR